MTQVPTLRFKPAGPDRELVMLGADQVGEILLLRGTRPSYSLVLGCTVRKRLRPDSHDAARRIIAMLVSDTLERFGCLDRGEGVKVVVEGLHASR